MTQILIQGFLLSGLYALIAVGFTLIFGVGRVLNLAYGALLMIGAYAYYWVAQVQNMPKLLGIFVAVIAGAFSAYLIFRLIVKPMKGDHVGVEIATLILAVVIQAAMVVATAVSWVALIGLYLFIRLTHNGRAMQAVSMDIKGAAISGINPEKIQLLTWAISGALAALAGVFFASYTQLNPTMWVAPLIVAVAVVIVGGIGSA